MQWHREKSTWPLACHSRFIRCKPHHWHVQDAGSGPLLLLLHGAGGATQSWRHLFGRLSQQFRVITLDLPGQGFTALGAQNRCGLDEMSEDIGKLCRDQGWQPQTLIGHSAGAAIALRLAEEMQPTPNVIGINAALSNFKGLAGVLFPALAKLLSATPFVARFFTASAARPGSVQRLIEGTGSYLDPGDHVHYQKLVSDRDHVNGTLAMMAQWRLDGLLSRLRHHPASVLLIAALNDKAVPPQTSRDAAAQLPRAQLATLPGLGHLAHEEDPHAVAELITNFVTDPENSVGADPTNPTC